MEGMEGRKGYIKGAVEERKEAIREGTRIVRKVGDIVHIN